MATRETVADLNIFIILHEFTPGVTQSVQDVFSQQTSIKRLSYNQIDSKKWAKKHINE